RRRPRRALPRLRRRGLHHRPCAQRERRHADGVKAVSVSSFSFSKQVRFQFKSESSLHFSRSRSAQVTMTAGVNSEGAMRPKNLLAKATGKLGWLEVLALIAAS